MVARGSLWRGIALSTLSRERNLLPPASLEIEGDGSPEIDLGKFYFTTFQGNREETPYMTADNFARVIDILRNEEPVYGNSSTGSVTTATEEVGEEES